MLTLKRLDIFNNFSSFFLVRWTLNDTTEDLSDYTFSILSSLSPNDGFAVLAADITDLEHQVANANMFDSSVHVYFKIKIKNIVTSEEVTDPIMSSLIMTPRDNIADAIIYQERYLLENILGRAKAKLLIRKRCGTRCTVCWDADTREITKSNCTSCYSTGYAGGYMNPVDVPISFTEPGYINKFDIGDIRDIQQNVTQAWASNYPLILPQDVIVDSTNRRFRVVQSQPTTKDGNIYLRQILQLQLIPPTDVIYKYII